MRPRARGGRPVLPCFSCSPARARRARSRASLLAGGCLTPSRIPNRHLKMNEHMLSHCTSKMHDVVTICAQVRPSCFELSHVGSSDPSRSPVRRLLDLWLSPPFSSGRCLGTGALSIDRWLSFRLSPASRSPASAPVLLPRLLSANPLFEPLRLRRARSGAGFISWQSSLHLFLDQSSEAAVSGGYSSYFALGQGQRLRGLFGSTVGEP